MRVCTRTEHPEAPEAMDMPTPDVEGYKAGNTMVSLIAANTPAEEGTSTLPGARVCV
ncbi:unnamed protein product [Ectocarpus sp. CCAP 1310/34]|nr:unnamed protein product [Ectocarpus sp. CCAP 1310/34]